MPLSLLCASVFAASWLSVPAILDTECLGRSQELQIYNVQFTLQYSLQYRSEGWAFKIVEARPVDLKTLGFLCVWYDVTIYIYPCGCSNLNDTMCIQFWLWVTVWSNICELPSMWLNSMFHWLFEIKVYTFLHTTAFVDPWAAVLCTVHI